jgi:hypothetical protein
MPESNQPAGPECETSAAERITVPVTRQELREMHALIDADNKAWYERIAKLSGAQFEEAYQDYLDGSSYAHCELNWDRPLKEVLKGSREYLEALEDRKAELEEHSAEQKSVGMAFFLQAAAATAAAAALACGAAPMLALAAAGTCVALLELIKDKTDYPNEITKIEAELRAFSPEEEKTGSRENSKFSEILVEKPPQTPEVHFKTAALER